MLHLSLRWMDQSIALSDGAVLQTNTEVKPFVLIAVLLLNSHLQISIDMLSVVSTQKVAIWKWYIDTCYH